jgi:hypothetical protein
MTAPLPLPTLLSQVLVAYTIEFDNEFERLMPHKTSTSRSPHAPRDAPWLVSLVMWSNFMRCVGEHGITVGELQRLARVAKPSLAGMQRWGYVVVAPDPADRRPKPPGRDWLVRPKPQGLKAQQVWPALFGVMEQRWQMRFGADAIRAMRTSLAALISQLEYEPPEYLPVLGYGLVTPPPHAGAQQARGRDAASESELPLSALLSGVLFAFAIEFESASELSLALCANVLRVLAHAGIRVRDLPRLAGVSKEAIAMAVGFLKQRRYLVLESYPASSRTKMACLTPKGLEAQHAYRRLLAAIEARWQFRFGSGAIAALREPLEHLVGDPAATPSPLLLAMPPYAEGWRASVSKPDTLPHYPMVLHRGGYPDGA